MNNTPDRQSFDSDPRQENGGYLPYHLALGERFCARAKSENWDEKKSKMALAIIQGKVPEPRSYMSEAESPDHMRKTRFYQDRWTLNNNQLLYGQVFQGDKNELKFCLSLAQEINLYRRDNQFQVNFNDATDEELEMYAKKLLHEKQTADKRKEMQNLRIKVHIFEAESRTKGMVAAETEGLFDEAVRLANDKIGYGTPRRGFKVSVTALNASGVEGKKETQICKNGSEVHHYLHNLKKTSFMAGLEDFPELIAEHETELAAKELASKEIRTDTTAELEEPIELIEYQTDMPKRASLPTDKKTKAPEGSTHNPFNDALKNWGKDKKE